MATDTLNPYDSPQGLEVPRKTWWKAFCDLFCTKAPPADLPPLARFLAGEPAIHYGVVFRVDPADRKSIFAAIPLHAVNDDAQVRRHVAEAARVLHVLLQRYPPLMPVLLGRVLVVSFINEYGRGALELGREVVPAEWWADAQGEMLEEEVA